MTLVCYCHPLLHQHYRALCSLTTLFFHWSAYAQYTPTMLNMCERLKVQGSSTKVSKQKEHGMHSNRQLRCSERQINTYIYTKIVQSNSWSIESSRNSFKPNYFRCTVGRWSIGLKLRLFLSHRGQGFVPHHDNLERVCSSSTCHDYRCSETYLIVGASFLPCSQLQLGEFLSWSVYSTDQPYHSFQLLTLCACIFPTNHKYLPSCRSS